MKSIYGLLVWFIATLFVVYSFCLNTAAAVFADPIRSSLHASNMEVSIAISAFILGFACMQIPAGFLLDKFNAKYVVSSGVLLLAIGNVLISYSNNIVLYTLANFVQGVGASFGFIAAAVLISQWFSATLFPILFGVTQTLSCVLSGIAHYFFTLSLLTYTWNELYRGLAVFGFILFFLTLLIVRSPQKFKRSANVSIIKSLKSVFSNKQILLCSLAAAFSFGILLAYAGLWSLQVEKFYDVDNLEAVIIGGIIFFGLGAGTPILGWVSNLFKSRTQVIHVSLCLGLMALLMGIYLPHYTMNTFIVAKLTAFLTGFFLSGSMLFYTMVSEIATNQTRGVAISVLNTAVFLMNTVMLFLPNLFVTNFSKGFFTYLWILPFFVTLAILLLVFIKDTYSSNS